MKKTSIFIGTLFLLLLSLSVIQASPKKKKAPTHRFGIYGSAIVAQGEFASTQGSKAGYANNGIGLMAEYVQYTKFPVNWMSSVSLNAHSFKAGALQDQNPEYGITANSYYTLWFMTGISQQKWFGPLLGVYGLAQIGFLYSHYPDIFYAKTEKDYVEYKETTEAGKAFAYALGAGIRYNIINLGVRYYVAYPRYRQTSAFGQGTVTRNLPAKILQVVFGINF